MSLVTFLDIIDVTHYFFLPRQPHLLAVAPPGVVADGGGGDTLLFPAFKS